MHAALVRVTIEPGNDTAARAALDEQVVPMVKAAPGFVAGYWMEPQDGVGFSIVVFETEEQARQTAPPAGSKPTEFATVDFVDFRRIIASA